MQIDELIIIAIAVFGLVFSVYSYGRQLKAQKRLKEREHEINRRVYELAILKELSDRIGYSLNVQQIVDIITGSLHQFIKYKAVSYMLVDPERVVFKIHLDESVHYRFVDDIRTRMIGSLSALLGREINKEQIDEVITGAILVENPIEPVRSFFNIPIVIGNKVEGILTIAHTEDGLYKEDEMTILYRIMRQASNAVTRLQEVIKNEERKLNAMVQSIREGVIMTDLDYRVTVINQAAKEAIGLVGKSEITIFDIIDKLGGIFDIRGQLEESVKFGKLIIGKEILIGERFQQIIISPVKTQLVGGSDDETLGGVVIFHDITREKEVEKLKEDFTSMMVHELRSPLDGIKKRIEVMREWEGKKDEKQEQEITASIYENASHMLELVNDLLDAAKLESGKFQIRKEPTNIRQVISNRVDFFSVLAKDSKIEIKTYFDPQLPEKINMDSLRVEQVLNNLLSNSLKFTDSGGSVTIHALRYKKGQDILKEAKNQGVQWLLEKMPKPFPQLPESVVVAVTDNGVGMSEKDLGQLFNKFKQFRASAVKKDKMGTGLGLFIAKGITESHGGLIGVHSLEGVGTTFYFTIPIE